MSRAYWGVMQPITGFETEPYTHRTANGTVYHLKRIWIILACGHRIEQRNPYYKQHIGDMRRCKECSYAPK